LRVNDIKVGVHGQSLMDRVVVLKASAFHNPPKDRRFLCTGGFGCYPVCSGKAIFGKMLTTGLEGRVTRYDVEGIAEHDQIGEEREERTLTQVGDMP